MLEDDKNMPEDEQWHTLKYLSNWGPVETKCDKMRLQWLSFSNPQHIQYKCCIMAYYI